MREKIRFGEGVIATMNDMAQDGWNVVGVLRDLSTGGYVLIPGKNIVTNDGDLYYAQKAVGDTPTDTWVGLRLGTAATAVGKTDTDVTTFGTDGDIATVSGYPKVNDGDADNTGAATDTVTWAFAYTTADGNITGIQEGAIVDSLSAPTACLSHFLFAGSFTKTSSNTLKVFVNHNFLGV